MRMSIRVSESASAPEDTLVQVMLSPDHDAAAAASPFPSQACSESKSEALHSCVSLEATKTAEQGSSSAQTTAGKPAAESQNQTAYQQQPSMRAVSKAYEQLVAPTLPEVPIVTSTAPTAEVLPANKSSAPVSLVSGAALSQSYGLPLPWPLPSWRPATTPAATTAAIPAATAATMTATVTAAIPATPTTILDDTTPAVTPAATSAASAAANAQATTSAAMPAAMPAATEAQITADLRQKLESSLADEAFQSHQAPEALASQNAPITHSSPSTTALATIPNLSSDSPHYEKLSRAYVSVPGSELTQSLESAQQRHMPTSALNSRLPMRLPLSAAASQSFTPPVVADADSDNTSSSQNGLHHHHGHPRLGLGSLTQLEKTAPEAPLSAQDAASDSAEHDLAEHDSIELAHFKPEQQALLAKGRQLCIQVQQV